MCEMCTQITTTNKPFLYTTDSSYHTRGIVHGMPCDLKIQTRYAAVPLMQAI